MNTHWIASSNGLPRDGQQIEFQLDFRNEAISGTYKRQAFCSRWAEYTVERVCSWRNLTPQCDPASSVRNPAERVLASAPRPGASHHPLPLGGMAHAA